MEQTAPTPFWEGDLPELTVCSNYFATARYYFTSPHIILRYTYCSSWASIASFLGLCDSNDRYRWSVRHRCHGERSDSKVPTVLAFRLLAGLDNIGDAMTQLLTPTYRVCHITFKVRKGRMASSESSWSANFCLVVSACDCSWILSTFCEKLPF